MSRYSEVERKFDADPGALLPDLSGVAGAVSKAVRTRLNATYFDTSDLHLARRGITLRRRTGGADAGWHLKLPAGRDERTEVRLPPGGQTRSVPLALASEVSAITGDRPLVPVAILHTVRIERRLLNADGAVLATVAEDSVQGQRLSDGAAGVSSWREVEVELVDGDRAFLDAVGSRLAAAGFSPSRSTSKLARVLGTIGAVTPAAGSDV
jgi:inorganic triphosphatase YgiF